MTTDKSYISKVLPVLFGFFVMGFCDVVGIATSYVKTDFGLSETLAGFIPSAVFFWFLLLSVPTALLMNSIGRKKTVQLSNAITIIGLMIPFFIYTFTSSMITFALLGIGNTMLQVALNPLLTNVVRGNALTSSLTAGQVVKATSSFCGPFIALFAVSVFGNWQYLFPIFACITLISAIWLMITPIPECQPQSKVSSIKETFALLSDKTILLSFLGIVTVVGVDVGVNTISPKLLMERCLMPVSEAGFGSSVYFLCRTCGAFIGAFLLAKTAGSTYFRWSIFIALLAMIGLFFVSSELSILALIGVVGFFISTIFPIIFSFAIKARPDKANEISGLMITGVFGGAVVPPLMGVMADSIGNQIGSLIVMMVCVLYLTICSISLKDKKA